MANKTVLVIGATGHLGTEICRLLTAEGKRLKGLVRATSAAEKVEALKSMGVETVEGDMKDRNSLDKAMQGVTHVISTATAIVSRQEGDSIKSVDEDGQGNVVHAAAAAGVQQLVYISFKPFEHSFPMQAAKQHTEKQIAASGVPYTILQPTVFMEVWLSPALGFNYPEAKATIYGNGNNKISFISQSDVARCAVAAIDNEKAINKTIELGGPQALTPLEAVRLFEEASGKKFETTRVPQEALEGQMMAAPDDISKSFAGLTLGYAKGCAIDNTLANEVFGIELQSVKAYAQKVSAPQAVAG